MTQETFRLIRGRTDRDFTMLGEPSRRLIFMGYGDTAQLQVQALETTLRTIGYSEDDLLRYQGDEFRLVVPMPELALSVTWENLVVLLKKAYPELSIPAAAELRAVTIKDLQNTFGTLSTPLQHGFEHPAFLTLDRLLEQKTSSAVYLRWFPWCTERVTDEYRGDGTTSGGVPEFITMNAPVPPGAKIIHLGRLHRERSYATSLQPLLARLCFFIPDV